VFKEQQAILETLVQLVILVFKEQQAILVFKE